MSESVENSAATAENDEQEDDDSMEKLQIDDEDEKNVSAEDILGGKTLIMSDSENDEEMPAAVTGKQISPKNRAQRLRDSDEEDDEALEKEQKVEPEVPETISSKPRKKISAIIDSDSDEEEQRADDIEHEGEKEKESSDIEENAMKPKQNKKISAIIDTDSEEEEKQEEDLKPKKKIKKQEKKKKQRLESDSSEQSSEDEVSSDRAETQNKLKGIVDSESECEERNLSADEQQETDEIQTGKPKKPKTVRASAKKALDGIQAIQSEQQRLHREAHISVPYHQPKPRTLKEFLSRRTINKPLAVALAGGSPMPKKTEPRRSLALRMNSEELQAYAKLMEERAKEATEFFKSESEHDDDSDGECATDKPDVPETVTEAVEEASQAIEATLEEPEQTMEIAAPPTENESPVEIEPTNKSVSPCKEMLVTEVVVLPKLDLSTFNITPPSKPTTPRISEAIRRLKEQKSCDASPSLKGDPNMVIDLETGDMFAKKPTGVDDLLQRLMKTREAKKHKSTDTVNILSTTHGKLELSKVSINLHEDEPVGKEQKPGAAYIKMQEHLKTLINKKRMDELRKKQAEDIEEEAEDDEGMDVDEEYEPDEKPYKSQVIINDDEEIVDEEVDENVAEDYEAEVEGETEVDAEAKEAATSSSSSESEQESEPEENTQTSKRKNRIIRAFQDDNSDEDDVDLLQTPKPSNVAPMTATQLQLSAHKLFDTEAQRTASDEENELLGLCSGRFTQSEVSSAAPTTIGALISQIPITQATPGTQVPDELEALCSGNFETQPEPATNKILSSDEEQPAEEKTRKKKLTKKRQKKKAKLGFSDDEESDEESVDDEEEAQDEMESEQEEPPEEIPEAFVDYDSEENEIVVKMTKKDRKLRAANFVEKEAELSESEWGSADEDEKNMDRYDIELGDEDEFDREKLRHELGQIHARKMLDKDIREVRKIKEMLFEDEEGAVRQRQFRWKNAENGLGFGLDDPRNENVDGEANEGSGDEENEHLWRKIRYEREQLLLENGLKGEASALSPAVTNSNTPGGAVRKLTIVTAKKTTMEMKKNSPFLISKSISTTQQQQAVRGSFLVRDKETLSKLAGMTKGAAGDVDGTAGTVSVKTAKAKNFVFATLTEEEHETQKRKAADLLNSSSETGVNFMKKPRLEPRRDKCLIDQLL